ncbi:MAG: PhnD/SsuA/transferrin family substrate-binding protein [Synechococcaceae cyanobacterium SM2_3_1]|nr:PhnD/SsuA/transferrin family substrate-binding protein [Synechococcaceae cyanobacterium SM2_3_1]
MNAMGFTASALGNHDFDFGPRGLRDLIGEDEGYPGTAFPYLSVNLDFSQDNDLSRFLVPNTQPPQPNTITGSIVVDLQGESVGIIGVTTPILKTVSSPGDQISIRPAAEDREDVPALAAVIQPAVDVLLDQGINKIILVTHLQQISNELALAKLLQGVDIIISGGSDTRLLDGTDQLFQGDAREGDYPILRTSPAGEPVAIVSTDGNYKYLGRLVVQFDPQGVMAGAIDPEISGAYATETDGPFPPNPRVAEIIEAMQGIIFAQDGNTFGRSTVFINGERTSVRVQETNLGNLTADANLAAAQAVDPTVVASLKNGGGIRASIGAIDPETGERTPPVANPGAGKDAGEISELDIANSIRFNNRLTLLTLTSEQLLAVLEHGVAAVAPGATPGQFPQVGGLAFSYDPTLPAGERVQSVAITSAEASPQGVVQGGEVVDPNQTFRIVTLNFLADGGDDYPYPQFASTSDRVDLVPADASVSFATEGGEQQALATYLSQLGTFSTPDTPEAADERIQNLAIRPDTVLKGTAAEPPPSSPKDLTQEPLVIGILTEADPYSDLATYLSEALATGVGDEIEVQVEGGEEISYPEAQAKIAQRQWDLVFAYSPMNGVAAADSGYTWIARMFPQFPPYYQSVFFVRADSPITRMDQITATTPLALGQVGSASRFFMPLYDLFGKTVTLSKDHPRSQDILDLVQSGQVEVGAVAKSELADSTGFRILQESRDIPGSGVYVSPRLPTEIQMALQAALLSAAPELQQAANYGEGEELDYAEFRKITQRVNEILNCTNLDQNPVQLFCQ